MQNTSVRWQGGEAMLDSHPQIGWNAIRAEESRGFERCRQLGEVSLSRAVGRGSLP